MRDVYNMNVTIEVITDLFSPEAEVFVGQAIRLEDIDNAIAFTPDIYTDIEGSLAVDDGRAWMLAEHMLAKVCDDLFDEDDIAALTKRIVQRAGMWMPAYLTQGIDPYEDVRNYEREERSALSSMR